MESVGPVEIGDSGYLPDFSRFEQSLSDSDSAVFRVKQSLSPLSPDCEKAFRHAHKRTLEGLTMGMELHLQLVVRLVPCFMRGILHSPTGFDYRPNIQA